MPVESKRQVEVNDRTRKTQWFRSLRVNNIDGDRNECYCLIISEKISGIRMRNRRILGWKSKVYKKQKVRLSRVGL